jgi:hypothetical protein
MSRPIFSAAAAVTVDVLIAPPRQAQHPRPCELEPGLRIIEGRVYYSAAWLDQATRTLRASDAAARSARRPSESRPGWLGWIPWSAG